MLFGGTKPLNYGVLFQKAKKLSLGLSRTGGRNAFGRITAFKKGGGRFRRLLRFVDFWRRLRSDAYVVRFERDAFRSATIALVFYKTGFLSYIVLPDGFSVGDKLPFGSAFSPKVEEALNDFSIAPNSYIRIAGASFWGNSLPLSDIPEGAFVFNVEFWPSKGAQLCRSAGASAVILSNRNGFTTLKLRSGWKIVLSSACYATVGISPNAKHKYVIGRKAGLSRNLGRRPTVRGVAMNAIDHPHGGGRGKTSGGPRPLTPWGKITKQLSTVSRKARQLLSSKRFR